MKWKLSKSITTIVLEILFAMVGWFGVVGFRELPEPWHYLMMIPIIFGFVTLCSIGEWVDGK